MFLKICKLRNGKERSDVNLRGWWFKSTWIYLHWYVLHFLFLCIFIHDTSSSFALPPITFSFTQAVFLRWDCQRVGDYWFMVQCTELLIIFCQYSSSVNSFSGSSKQSSVISVGEYMIPEKPKGFAQVVSRQMISAFQVSRHMSWVESIKAMNSLRPPTYSLLWPVGFPGVHGLWVNCIYSVVYCWFHFNHH